MVEVSNLDASDVAVPRADIIAIEVAKVVANAKAHCEKGNRRIINSPVESLYLQKMLGST